MSASALGSGCIHRSFLNRVFRKVSTSTLSLVQNRVRFLNNLQNSTLAFKGSNSEMHHFSCQTEFHPVLNKSFLFPPDCLHCCYIYFHCSYLYNYYNYLEPCALHAEFSISYPDLNKTSLLFRPRSKRG
jgi:hypothetical protein